MKSSKGLHVTVGKLEISRDGTPLQTTLGSCVSVILYFVGSELTASMSHYLLAKRPEEILPHTEDARRYGDSLLEEQLEAMRYCGPEIGLRAMIFGGSRSQTSYHSTLISEIE